MSDPRGTTLHVGTGAFGVASLPDLLDRNREQLASRGVGYLGRGTRAVRDLLGLLEPGDPGAGAWRRLVEQSNESSAPWRLLSNELLGRVTVAQAREAVRALGPDPVRVVVTVADVAGALGAAWQDEVRRGDTVALPNYVASATAEGADEKRGGRFRRRHDVLPALDRWAGVVGAGNVRLVVVPQSAPPADLWARFCTALDIDPAGLDTAPGDTNPSLALGEVDLLRRLNRRVGAKLSKGNYERYMRSFLVEEVMARGDAAARHDSPPLSPEAHAWATRRADAVGAAARRSRVRVVGDLAELAPPPSADAAGGELPGSYPETAVRAIAMLLRKLIEIDPDAEAQEEASPQRGAGQKARRAKQSTAQRGSQ